MYFAGVAFDRRSGNKDGAGAGVMCIGSEDIFFKSHSSSYYFESGTRVVKLSHRFFFPHFLKKLVFILLLLFIGTLKRFIAFKIAADKRIAVVQIEALV